MNKVNNLQQIRSNKQSKYDEIIDYLKQDNGYWLENDKWDTNSEIFFNKEIKSGKGKLNIIDFSNIKNERMKNELKYYFLYSFKNKYLSNSQFYFKAIILKKFTIFSSTIVNLNNLDKYKIKNKWKLFLINNGITALDNNNNYLNFTNILIDFIKEFYDDREETEKDIWYSNNIRGARIPASGVHGANGHINFTNIPAYYKDTVKRYFKTIITKKSWNHCHQIICHLNYFFTSFYYNGYKDGFIEHLARQDIENYLYWLNNDYKEKNPTYRCKFVSYVRTFLEYIQIAQYNKAPKKEISFLIFQDDIPKRERVQDEMRKVKFVPEPILKQLDNNIMDLDRPQYIPIYILLRETGWRGTDILNLRYHNCLEQIWNNKEQSHNYYLCGEITKTGIAQLKIPVRDKVAEMIQKSINKAKELSTEENNPKKYLFDTYEGKLKGRPLNKASLLLAIKRLIEQKYIRDVNGELYHFRLHSLRHYGECFKMVRELISLCIWVIII
ncbi:tyrosine-type recombinase/integrase [Clostridium sp.]|uniref:tyrosine-type recombinase/integrase n=1 Tax=Clostridium sp. TaxID=1506 RepID=UPI003D6D1800